MADRPTDIQYTKSHEWVRVEGDEATVGITDFAVEHLGDLVFVDLPEVGHDARRRATPPPRSSRVKAVGEVYSPVAGEVIEVNEDLADDQAPLASDPFGAGLALQGEARRRPAGRSDGPRRLRDSSSPAKRSRGA